MNLEQNIFKCAEVDFAKLASYGFIKRNDEWVYEALFMNGAFRAVVKIDAYGNVSGDVYEPDNDDIYFPLRIESMATGFAGEVRAAYAKILQNIKENCCHINYFIYPQTNRLVQNIYQKYGDTPIFPWEKYDDCGVFKNPATNKWYALIMTIDKSKLDKKLNGKVEVMNLKLSEDKILQLTQQKGFYPAYHMNKKNWITIVLDDSQIDDVLLALIDESHSFTLEKRFKKAKK